ncbi:MAG: hypothetical protein KDD82_13745 [Planctomycetes bacterium]|nr:hypothetical protein [Planctomycetota bacterium]
MARRTPFLLTVCCQLLLGCGAPQQGTAQDTPPDPAQPKEGEQPTSRPAQATEEARAEDARVYRARIQEKGKKPDETFELRQVVVLAPKVSLFGGGSGEPVKSLELRNGAARIQVPLHRLKTLRVLEEVEDQLQVTVKLRASAQGGEETLLEGRIKANLELQGTYGASGLETIVKLREVTTAEFSVDP